MLFLKSPGLQLDSEAQNEFSALMSKAISTLRGMLFTIGEEKIQNHVAYVFEDGALLFHEDDVESLTSFVGLPENVIEKAKDLCQRKSHGRLRYIAVASQGVLFGSVDLLATTQGYTS